MCACALRGGPVEMFVVSHHDIGRRKLAEERAARLGGDEFALILGNTDLAGAGRIAHGVRHDVAELRIALRGGRMLSISAGYAAVVPGAGQFEDGLLHEADKALYAAKASGGSRERAYARF